MSAAGDLEELASAPSKPNNGGPIRLADVLLLDPPNPWAPHMLRLYAVLFISYLCATTNGFDSNTFGGLLATQTFLDHFRINDKNEGVITAIYVIGNCLGSLFAATLADRYGRRAGMAVGSIVCIIGVCLQTTSNTIPVLMIGRFILGLGAVFCSTAGPAYAVEMSHPAYRGVLTGLYQSCFFLGTITSTFTEYALSFQEPSAFQWRFPMAMQAAPSIIILVFIKFIPETPRWHIAHGQDVEAHAVLSVYHGSEEIVDLEMEEMKAVISTEGSDKRWWDYSGFFSSRSNWYRFSLVAAIAWFGELGFPPTSYYLPLMVAAAGITSKQTQLLLNAIQTPVMTIFALSGLRYVDSIGRRPLLMFSSSGMVLCVIVIAACTANQVGHPVVGGIGIAFIYVFLAVFAFAWTPCQYLYPVEVLSFENRGKGLAALNLMNNLVKLVNTYVPPVAIRSIGWRFYIFYAIFDASGVAFMYRFFVETRGRNLEEMDAIFVDPNPVQASLCELSKPQQRSHEVDREAIPL
ncbi:general substrate transporter [Calocera cornea HHB12733]|uniref:General substrate transporter n=1 Tax=Calocera cornea HHB12733 TaxID=1353952 RepID=A0A165CNB5_9BASI|nr:general substrate transporter [Calocera cornea HHB12733]